jgi:ABC-2 type transport system ATP-binding protein
MIIVNHLTKIYLGEKKPALNKISFAVEPGHIFALLGPNGAGKTTLIRILSTLILPTRGSASVCGYDVIREGSKVRRCIGMAAGGERSFYFRLTGYQNLEFFGGLMGLRSQELKSRIEYLLDLVGLSDARNLLFMKYSSGMKRKLSLARSLLADPPVYLFDEPTSGVAPDSAIRIREIIEELKARGKTILLATHNMEEADKLSDVVGILKEGKLLAVDTPFNLRRILRERRAVITFTPQEQLTWSNDAVNNLARRFRQVKGISDVSVGNPEMVLSLKGSEEITPIIEILANSGLRIRSIETQEPSLEDVFIRVTGDLS